MPHSPDTTPLSAPARPSPAGGLATKLHTRRDGEAGQSLVLVVLAMFMILAVAAYAIDVANWYQKRHQAQIAADSAALAAAGCLASGQAGSTCTSTSDTTAAVGVATTIAKANGVTIATSDVTFNGATVAVTTTNPAAPLFVRAAGLGTVSPTAHAKAAYKNTAAPAACTGSFCAAIFAGGTNCTDQTGGEYTSDFAGAFGGDIISNGYVDVTMQGNFDNNSSVFYGSSCPAGTPGGYVAGSGIPTPKRLTSVQPYPEDWRSGGNETPPACTYTTSHLPTGATASGANITINLASTSPTGVIPTGVYCASSATGQTNGTITVTGSTSTTTTSHVTFIADALSLPQTNEANGVSRKNLLLAPCTSADLGTCPASNVLLIWQTGTSVLTVDNPYGPNGTTGFGTIFAPSAHIDAFSPGGTGATGFIEGDTVAFHGPTDTGNAFQGNGPKVSTTGSTTSLGPSLVG